MSVIINVRLYMDNQAPYKVGRFLLYEVLPKNRVGICVCLERKLLQLQSILCKRLNLRHKCGEVFGSHVSL